MNKKLFAAFQFAMLSASQKSPLPEKAIRPPAKSPKTPRRILAGKAEK